MLLSLLRSFGLLFYCVLPEENVFDTVKDVPSYATQALPAFIVLTSAEIAIKLYRGKPVRINDAISSTFQGLWIELSRLWTFGIEIVLYTWIYDRFRFIYISPHSIWTWIFCIFAVDFSYYCIHRLMHGVNLFWAVHQVHHSSEEYNYTIVFRLPILRPFLEWITALPLAFAIPPPLFLVHYELQLLMQAWVHTEEIGQLGWVDYIFNTPSNHRVHHGRNRRCIDRNFGGIFMIWDHLFDTYEPEGNKRIYFGLTTPIKTFNPFYIQFHHFFYIWKNVMAVKGFGNKLSVIFKGPGWMNKMSQSSQEITEFSIEKKYNPPIPVWQSVYALLHSLLILFFFASVVTYHQNFNFTTKALLVGYMIVSTTSIGVLLDGHSLASHFEVLRCDVYYFLEGFEIFAVPKQSLPALLWNVVHGFHSLSIGLHLLLICHAHARFFLCFKRIMANFLYTEKKNFCS